MAFLRIALIALLFVCQATWTLAGTTERFSHDLSKNVKASILATHLVTAVHNQGYPWELPTKYNILSYASNGFYVSSPLGLNGATLPNPVTVFYGDNYYPYGPAGISPYGNSCLAFRRRSKLSSSHVRRP